MKKIKEIEKHITHPSEILVDELDARGISVDVFSKLMEMDLKKTTDLLNKKITFDRKITSKIEKVLNIPARIFINLQSEYDDKLKKIELV